jgi:hypothetical protein
MSKKKQWRERERGGFNLITGDKYETGEIFDKSFATGNLVTLTPEMAKDLALQGKQKYDGYLKSLRLSMNAQKALQVKDLRMNKQVSWRGIAAWCFVHWNGNWYPPTNQLAGMAICEVASEILNEIVD